MTDTRARDALAEALCDHRGDLMVPPMPNPCTSCQRKADILVYPYTPDQRRALAAAFLDPVTPSTEAGRRLAAELGVQYRIDLIRAAEAEAAAAVLAELEAGVRQLPASVRLDGIDTALAVLDLIRKAGER